MRINLSTQVVGVVLLGTIVAVGDEGTAPAPDLSGFSELSLEALLETPVYAASKREQQRSDVPAFVTVITAEDIRRYGYRTLTDVIAGVGSFYKTDDHNYLYLGARGFSRPGDYNSRVLLLLNGHRLNDPLFDSADALTAPDLIDLDTIDRIEIIRGPGSSMYGASAVFGVINVITRTGESGSGGEVSIAAGSHETWAAHLSYGETFMDGLDLYVSVAGGEQGGRIWYVPEYDAAEFNNGISPKDADAGWSWNSYVRLAGSNWVVQFGYSGHEDQIPTASYGTVFGREGSFTEDTYAFVDLTRSQVWNDDLSSFWRLGLDEYIYDAEYLLDASEKGDQSWLLPNVDDSVADWFTVEGQVRYHGFESHTMTLGSEYRHNFNIDYVNYDEGYRDAPYTDIHADTWVWAAYVEEEVHVTEGVQFTAGLRYDDYELAGDSVSPRVALLFDVAESTRVKLLHGTAFRPPNVFELYWVTGGADEATPDLDSEVTRTYECVVEQALGGHGLLTASAFRYEMDDLIQLVDAGDGALQYANIAEAEADGLEVEWTERIGNGVEGRVAYGLTDAEDGDGETLSNSPEQLGRVNVSFPVGWCGIVVAVETQYVADRLNVYGDMVDDYWLANLTLSTRELWRDTDLSFSVYNFFDVTYADPASEEHVQGEIEQDGTTYRVKLTRRF